MYLHYTKKKCLFLLFVITNLTVVSQQSLQAVLLDSITHKPIENANIVFGNFGTISNANGEFAIFSEIESRKATISIIGYKNKMVLLKHKDTLFLSPQVYELDTVVIIDLDKKVKKILSNFEKNKAEKSYCENFYYKGLVKQNGKYAYYLETLGITKTQGADKKRVYIKGKRETEDISVKYISFETNLYDLLNEADTNLLKKGNPINYKFVSKNTLKITFERLHKKKKFEVYIDPSKNIIKKIAWNTLNNQLENSEDVKFLFYKFGHYFDQGESSEIDFKMVNGKYYATKIYSKGKATFYVKKIKEQFTFDTEELYFVTSFDSICPNLKSYTKLKKESNLLKKKIKNHIVDWNLENRVLPLEGEIEILKALEWRE